MSLVPRPRKGPLARCLEGESVVAVQLQYTAEQ